MRKFKITEENAKDAPCEKIEWEGQEMQTDQKPLMDSGAGKLIILRTFDFQLPPLKELPTKKQLLDFHKSKIMAFLWRDELTPIQEFKLAFSKNCDCCKQENRHFRIFAVCQAKQGSNVLEKPQRLQDIVHATN